MKKKSKLEKVIDELTGILPGIKIILKHLAELERISAYKKGFKAGQRSKESGKSVRDIT